MNWRVGYPCSGQLSVSSNQSEVELQDLQLGVGSALTNSDRIDMRGRCHIYDRLYATFGSGAVRSAVTTSPLTAYDQVSGRGGFEYGVPNFRTIGVEVASLQTDYVNRQSTFLNPLATSLSELDFRAYYRMTVSPKTSFSISAGASEFTTFTNFGQTSQLLPSYSANVSYRLTPKISLFAATQFSSGPTQGVTVSDFQNSTATTFSAVYAFSRKLSFTAAYAMARTQSNVTSGLLGTAITQDTNTNTFSLDANYRVSPFIVSGLGYRHFERTSQFSGASTSSNLYTFSVSYRH